MRLQQHSGFTLVEVLIALLILAVAMTALQLRITQQVDSAAYLRDKTVASWVALNQYELFRIQNRATGFLPTQTYRGSTEMGNQRWYWQLIPTFPDDVQAEDAALAAVTISVSNIDFTLAETEAIYSLTGVLDDYHSLR